MKKLLFTGGTGFLGRNLIPILKTKYEVLSPARNELNLKDERSIDNYFEGKYFDAIIHAAIPNVAFCADDSESTLLRDSLYAFEKLAGKHSSYGKMIYFGSGAEFDKSADISMIKEDEFGNRIPRNDYGLAKYIMNDICTRSKNIYNLRIFGCYGPTDANFKLITSVIRQCISGKDVVLNQNCYFDFMYVDDIAKILFYFVENTPKYHDYNICTGVRTEIKTIVDIIKNKMDFHGQVIVSKAGMNNEYTADNTRLLEEIPDIKFTDITEGIDKMIKFEMERIENEKTSC